MVTTVLFSFTMSAQTHTTNHPFRVGPPFEQQSTNSVRNPQSILGILKYDNGELSSGMGSLDAHTLGVYHKFPVDLLTSHIGESITHFNIGLFAADHCTQMTLQIFEDSLNTTPVVANDLNVEDLVSGFNLLELTDSYEIPADKVVLIGVYIESSGGYSITIDTDGTTEPENSTFFVFDGVNYGAAAGWDYFGDAIVQGIITDNGIVGGIIDLEIVGATTQTDNCTLSATESILVTLKNNGDEIINEEFSLFVNINDVIVSSQVSPTGFEVGTEIEVEISSFDMLAYGLYSINVTHDFNDHVVNNNELDSVISTGDAIITVDLTTDAASGDNTWFLYDENDIVVARNGDLAENTNYVTDICVISTGCYRWAIYDIWGDGLSGGITPPGSFTIYYNGVEKATSPVDGNFGSEFIAFGLGGGCPENDIVLNDIFMPELSTPTEIDIRGEVLNIGVDNLTSFDVIYKIGEHTSSLCNITGIDIPTGNTYQFTHDEAYNFDIDGNYEVEVIISKPNGFTDPEPNNNVSTHNITIVSGIFKKQLFEHFTASTCGPCASYTPTADALLAANNDSYSLIRYHVNWPLPGDAYYIPQAGDRKNYYAFDGVPSVYRNGVFDMDVSQEEFNTNAVLPSVFSIDVTASYNNNTVAISAEVGVVSDIEAGLTVHIVVVENKTTGNVGTNGETEFHNVMMAMLPSSSGTIINAIAADGTVTINESYDMSTTFVEEMSDLTAIIFVQNNATKEVLQSEMVAIGLVGVNNKVVETFNTYPNPFYNTLIIENLENATQIVISNILGQSVMTVNVFDTKMVIPTAKLNKGIYFITVFDKNNNTRTKKMIKQ